MPPSSLFPPRRWSGAGVGVGLLRGAGDSLTCHIFTFQISNFQMFKLQTFKFQLLQFPICNIANFQFSNLSFLNLKLSIFGTYTFQIVQTFRSCFNDVPIFFLYSLQHSGDKYGVRGSRFGDIFGRSRNHPKSIAIDHESLISHFGIIKIPEYFRKLQKNETRNNRLIFLSHIKPL